RERGNGTRPRLRPGRAVSATAAMSESATATPLLRVRGLSRYFGAVPAVRGVDLDVLPGERRAILGPNGAGKSTLFNLIAGDLVPTDGSVELFGRDVTTLAVRKRARLGLGRTYQTSRVLGGLTVGDNLYLAVLGAQGGHLRPLRSGSDGAIRARALEIAEQVGLPDRLEALAGSLS